VSSDLPRSALLETWYEHYLRDQDSAAYIRKISLRYTVGTLAGLVERGSRYGRRAAVLALGFLGDFEANSVLGRALADHDRGVRMLADSSIRNVWRRNGSPDDRHDLDVVIRFNSAQNYDQAARKATTLLERAPWFAEVWNQRAIALYCMSRWNESIRDCHQALELNPYHFGAAAGMGQCFLQMGKQASALECFRRALGLNQDMEGVRAHVVYLERVLKKLRDDG